MLVYGCMGSATQYSFYHFLLAYLSLRVRKPKGLYLDCEAVNLRTAKPGTNLQLIDIANCHD